jgi:hypothetical protein
MINEMQQHNATLKATLKMEPVRLGAEYYPHFSPSILTSFMTTSITEF